MKLLFLWIENYHCFKNANLNFSDSYTFNYDLSSNLLTCDTNNLSFFPQADNHIIDEVSAIVGSNGSGKSTISSFFSECIFCASSSSKYMVVTNVENSIYLKANFTPIIAPNLNFADNNYLPPFQFVYYSPHYSPSDKSTSFIYDNYHFNSISTTNLLNKDIETYLNTNRNQNDISQLTAHKILDFHRCVDFLSNCEFNRINITLPQEIVIRFEMKNVDVYESMISNDNNWLSIFTRIKQIIDLTTHRKYSFEIRKEQFIASIEFLLFCNYARNYLTQDNPNLPTIYSRLSEICSNSDDNNPILMRTIFNAIGTIEQESKIQNMNTFVDLLKSYDVSYFNTHTMVLKIVEEKDIIKEVFNNYQKAKSIVDFLIFDFDPYPSSGELSEFILYSRLYSFLNTVANGESIILFLDEIESTLHPKLQQQLMQNTIDFLQIALTGRDNIVHIMFASHSPILLSDIPASNVILLEKQAGNTISDIQKASFSTFGANIYTLYKNSFFLRETLMGDFAKKQIDKLLNNIDNYSNLSNEEKQKLDYIVSLVGEPILKKLILDRYK